MYCCTKDNEGIWIWICSSGRPPVEQWCHCISCGPTSCTASTRWSCCRHPCSRQHSNICLISLGHPSQHQRPRTWSSSCWHRNLYFPCQPSMPRDWRYTPPGCPIWAPGHQHREAPMAHQCGTYAPALPASSELRTESPDAHQLPRQNLHCIDHWPAHGSGHCGSCPWCHTQPIRPHPGSWWPTTGHFLAHDRGLSQGQQRQNRAVS